MRLSYNLKTRVTKSGKTQDIVLLVDFDKRDNEATLIDIFTFDWDTQVSVSMYEFFIEELEEEIYRIIAKIDWNEIISSRKAA